MPTVRELTALYENFMLGPAHGPGVCATCLTFTEGFSRCYACASRPSPLDAVAPISYSVAHEQLHHALASYKRLSGDVARRLQLQLTAVLWRYLDAHEHCLATRVGIEAFPIVTTVPPGVRHRGSPHPLPDMVGRLCGPTRERYQPLLEHAPAQSAEHIAVLPETRAAADGREPTSAHAGAHDFNANRYQARATLTGQPVLLIDDTWTTGASAQSAAAALKRAGAGPVGAVVIGRHLKRDWRENDARLRAVSQPFDWETCVHCRAAPVASARQCHR